MMKKPLVIAAALTTLAITGCMVSFGPPNIITENVAVPAVETLSVQNSVGSIEITGTARSDVAITAYVYQITPGLIPGMQTPAESVQLDIDTSDGILVRHAPYDARGISIEYEIQIPTGLAIDRVASSTGSITVRDVAGDALLETSTGSITVEGAAGTVSASTSTGSISVRDADAVSSLSSDTGAIMAEIRGLPADETPIPISTSTGSITLYIDPSLRLTVRAETGTGSITVHEGLQLVISQFERDGLEATMNGGGNLLSVDTATGSISLYPLN